VRQVRLRSQRREDLWRAFGLLGYSPNLVARSYPVWIAADTTVHPEFVAFTRSEPMDMSTAAVVGAVVDGGPEAEDSISAARALAAPVLLHATPDEVLVMATTTADDPQPWLSVSYEDLQELARHRTAIGPQSLLAAKLGTRQLALFPIDVNLLAHARADSAQRLAPRIERALEAAVDTIDSQVEIPELSRSHQIGARLVIGALTALVLRDKRAQLSDLSAGTLIDVAQQTFPDYFSWIQGLSDLERHVFEALINDLGEGINYRSLDPAILSDVYETTLVSDVERNHLAIHYTPPGLARRILADVPIEIIPPDNRSVLDPTCGSGNLLIAAHDRLAALQPLEWDALTAHRELAAHLRGFDRDAFAVEVARLSLLLHAMPLGNSWRVEQRDALAAELPGRERPSLIVANPPWSNTNLLGGRRSERADDFLRWMVRSLLPEGLLAVVLPAGWLGSRTGRNGRRELQESCALFEVWRLPEQTFTSSSMAPAILLAQKHGRADWDEGGRVFRRVLGRANSLDRFYVDGADETYLLTAPSNLEAPLMTGALTLALHERTDLPPLSEIATVRAGPQPLSGVEDRRREGTHWFLRGANFPQFGQPRQEDLIRLRHPEDFQANRGAAEIGRAKVLASAERGPNNPWRLKVGLDLRGIAVSNSLHMIVPKDGEENILYGILALLGSGLASCWVDEQAVERNINTRVTGSLPVPSDPSVWTQLSELGRALAAAAGDPSTLGSIVSDLEEAVWRIYSIEDPVRDVLTRRLAGFRAPEQAVRYPTEQYLLVPDIAEGDGITRFGSVLEVEGGRLRIWVPGITKDSGDWISVPPNMPGWMCRAGATFDVSGPTDDLTAARYHFQEFSYSELGEQTELA
jgi:N-6 DNA Methylase